MKTLTAIFFILFTLVMLPDIAYGASSEVTWTDYEKYRDIYPSNNESRKHFRERTFKNFEKHFTKLAEKLPEGQIVKIDVTDVDLAGDTYVGDINQLRIVKDVYFPQMDFSYQLLNADGSEVMSGKVELKDMSFLWRNNLRYNQDSLSYEKKMLDDWFADTFKDQIVVQEK